MRRRGTSFGRIRIPLPAAVLMLRPSESQSDDATGSRPGQWPGVQHHPPEPSSTAPPPSAQEPLFETSRPNIDLIGPSARHDSSATAILIQPLAEEPLSREFVREFPLQPPNTPTLSNAAPPSLDLFTPRRRFSDKDVYIQPSPQTQLSISAPASPSHVSAVSVRFLESLQTRSPSPSTGTLTPFPLFDPNYPHSPDWEPLELASPSRAASPLSNMNDGLNGTLPNLTANPSTTPPPPTTPQPEVRSESPSDFSQTADPYLMSGALSPSTPPFSDLHNTSGALSPIPRPSVPTSSTPRVRLPPSSPTHPANSGPALQPADHPWTHSFRSAAAARFTRRDAGGDDRTPAQDPPTPPTHGRTRRIPRPRLFWIYSKTQQNRSVSPDDLENAERYGVGDGEGEVQWECDWQESGDVDGTELAYSYSFCEDDNDDDDLDEDGFLKYDRPDAESDPAEVERVRELFDRVERDIAEDWMDEPFEADAQQPMPTAADEPPYMPPVSLEELERMMTLGGHWVSDGTEIFYWNGHQAPDMVVYPFQDIADSHAWYAAQLDAASNYPVPQPIAEAEPTPEFPMEDAPPPASNASDASPALSASNTSDTTVRPIQRSADEAATPPPEPAEPAQPAQPTEPTPPTLPINPLAAPFQPTTYSVGPQELTTFIFIAPEISDDAARLLPQPPPQPPPQPRAIHPLAKRQRAARNRAATALRDPNPPSEPRAPPHQPPRARFPNPRFPPDRFPFHPANLDRAGKPRPLKAGPNNNSSRNNNNSNGRGRPFKRPYHQRRPPRGLSPHSDPRIPQHLARTMRPYERWEQTVSYHLGVSAEAEALAPRDGLMECDAGVALGFLYSATDTAAASSAATSLAATSSVAASSAAASSAAGVGEVGGSARPQQRVKLHDHTAPAFAPPPCTTRPLCDSSWHPNPWLDAAGRAVAVLPPKKTEAELEEVRRAWKEWVVRERVRGYLKMKREGASDQERKTEERVEGKAEENEKKLPEPDVAEYTFPPPDCMRFRFRVTDGSRRVGALAAAAVVKAAETASTTATTATTAATATATTAAATAATAARSAPANGAGPQAKAKPKCKPKPKPKPKLTGANGETRRVGVQYADFTAYLERRAYAAQRRQPRRWFNGAGLFGGWIEEVRGEISRLRREREEERRKRREERKKRNEERARRREERNEERAMRREERKKRMEAWRQRREVGKKRKEVGQWMEKVEEEEEPEEEEKGGAAKEEVEEKRARKRSMDEFEEDD